MLQLWHRCHFGTCSSFLVCNWDYVSFQVRLLDQHGTVLVSCEDDSPDDGKNATVVELISGSGEVQHFTRNEDGGFSQIFQHNKWRLKREAREFAGQA